MFLRYMLPFYNKYGELHIRPDENLIPVTQIFPPPTLPLLRGLGEFSNDSYVTAPLLTAFFLFQVSEKPLISHLRTVSIHYFM